MFRYYSWLPLALEPEYKDGFTCDNCHKDFLSGPFYHQQDTGTDYCLTCGSENHLTPFKGLVCSLLFSDSDELLRDTTTGAFAVFAYQLHRNIFGLHFSNGASVVFQISATNVVESLRYWSPPPSSDYQTLAADRWRERFPWLSKTSLREVFSIIVQLHDDPPVDSLPVTNDCRITDYQQTERNFMLQFENGWQQVFDSQSGVEIVATKGHAVAILTPRHTQTRIWTQDEAQQLYEEMVTMLADAS